MDYAVRLFIHRDIQEAKAFVILFVSVDTPPLLPYFDDSYLLILARTAPPYMLTQNREVAHLIGR